MLDDIIRRIRAVKRQMEQTIPFIHQDIKDIINSKNHSTKRIEKLLDVLLNYGQMGVGEAEFRRLNSYYESFNKTNAKFYSDAYREMNE